MRVKPRAVFFFLFCLLLIYTWICFIVLVFFELSSLSIVTSPVSFVGSHTGNISSISSIAHSSTWHWLSTGYEWLVPRLLSASLLPLTGSEILFSPVESSPKMAEFKPIIRGIAHGLKDSIVGMTAVLRLDNTLAEMVEEKRRKIEQIQRHHRTTGHERRRQPKAEANKERWEQPHKKTCICVCVFISHFPELPCIVERVQLICSSLRNALNSKIGKYAKYYVYIHHATQARFYCSSFCHKRGA